MTNFKQTTQQVKVNLKGGGGYQAVIDLDQDTVFFTKYNIITDVLDLVIDDIYDIKKAYEKALKDNLDKQLKP